MEVRTDYLERELIRVTFASSHLVSDHPPQYGGEGKGPSPGELLLAGLTASSVFDTRLAAVRSAANVTTIVVRAMMQVDREGREGPLGPLSIITHVARRLELTGALTEAEAARLIQDGGFARTLEQSIELDESCSFTDNVGRVSGGKWLNEILQSAGVVAAALKPGERLAFPARDWRVHATEIASGLAIVHLSGAPILVSTDGRMGSVTPHDLMMAALATCTTIYVARNARFQSIPVTSVTVRVTADAPVAGQAISNIQKRTVIGGELTQEQSDKCAFFAKYCAIGESLKRGIPLRSELAINSISGNENVLASGGAIDALGQLLANDPLCGDGSCCIA